MHITNHIKLEFIELIPTGLVLLQQIPVGYWRYLFVWCHCPPLAFWIASWWAIMSMYQVDVLSHSSAMTRSCRRLWMKYHDIECNVFLCTFPHFLCSFHKLLYKLPDWNSVNSICLPPSCFIIVIVIFDCVTEYHPVRVNNRSVDFLIDWDVTIWQQEERSPTPDHLWFRLRRYCWIRTSTWILTIHFFGCFAVLW